MTRKTAWLAAIALTSACASDLPNNTAGGEPATAYRVERTERALDDVPYLIQGKLGVAAAPLDTLADVDAALSAAMIEIGRSIQVPADQLIPKRVEHDALGMTHVRYAQRAHGLPVVGGQVIVHLGSDGVIRSVTNGARDASTMQTVPRIDASIAAERAKAATPTAVAASAPELVYVITNGDGDLAFAWRTEVTGTMLRDDVFVDAISGEIVARHPHVHTARNRRIISGYDIATGGGAQTVVGTEGNAPTEAVAKFAYDNTGVTYDCYQALFNRDSYDSVGAQLVSVVHVVANGQPFQNAAWTGSEMVYGDGDGVQFGVFPKALDVTAHELTHAVTENSAELVYQLESGALNEASSDILGATCETFKAGGAVSANTWLIGEDIYTPSTPGDALRYMNHPTMDASIYGNDGFTFSRDYYPERMTFTQPPGQNNDQGGVHFNSGIANLAFQLMVEGGKHPRNKTAFTATGIGIEKASKIWYRALTMYMTANETFAQARTHTEMAAQDLYPGSTKTAISLAWATVGVGAAPIDNSPPTITLTSPVDGTTIPNTLTITADAADDLGILRVEFTIDGTIVGTVTSAPYTFTTTMPVALGPHLIVATAYDAVNKTSDQAAVNLFDPTCGNSCSEDQSCNMANGACEDKDGGGCCSTGGGGAVGSLSLFFATAFLIGGRRRRRRST